MKCNNCYLFLFMLQFYFHNVTLFCFIHLVFFLISCLIFSLFFSPSPSPSSLSLSSSPLLSPLLSSHPSSSHLLSSHPSSSSLPNSPASFSPSLSPPPQDMRASVWSEYEREYRDHIGYKADPLEWLASNWQGAAIGSLIARRPCKRLHSLLHYFCLLVSVFACFYPILFCIFVPSFLPISFLHCFLTTLFVCLNFFSSFYLLFVFSFILSSFHFSLPRTVLSYILVLVMLMFIPFFNDSILCR